MAVDYNRQYVGARYVPKVFENTQGGMEWEANTYYEPLTLVTYNNSNYMSKKPVPNNIGNPTQNLQHWAYIGSFNATLNHLSEIVTDFLKGYNGLSYRRFVLVGDSYAQGWSSDGNTTSWAVLLKNFITTFDGKAEIYASGGAGWVAVGQQSQTFVTLLQGIPNPETVTDVIVAGGYNDYNKTVSPAILTNAFLRFKNAKSYYFPVGNTYKYPSNRLQLVTTARNLGYALGTCTDVKAFTALHLHSLFSSDGYHPSQNGQNEIAAYIWNKINGIDSMGPSYIPYQFDDFPNIEYTSSGEKYQLSFSNFTIPSSITGMQPIYTKPLEEIDCMFPTLNKYSVNFRLTIKDSEGFKNIPMVTYIDSSNKIYITPLLVTLNSFETLTGITSNYLTGRMTLLLDKYYF